MKLLIPGNLNPNNVNMHRLDELVLQPTMGVPSSSREAYEVSIAQAVRRMGDGVYFIFDSETGEVWKIQATTTTTTELTNLDRESSNA